MGKLSPLPSEEDYEKCQAKHEINTINNLNYEALQEPEYLNFDGKKGDLIDVTTADDGIGDKGEKPKGNYGGIVR